MADEAKSIWPTLAVFAVGVTVGYVAVKAMRKEDPAKFQMTLRRVWEETPRSMRNADHIGGYFGVPTSTARQWLRDAQLQ